MILHENQAFDFWRTMVRDPKNLPDNLRGSVPVSNNRPTVD
jgi:hypothetical protein